MCGDYNVNGIVYGIAIPTLYTTAIAQALNPKQTDPTRSFHLFQLLADSQVGFSGLLRHGRRQWGKTWGFI